MKIEKISDTQVKFLLTGKDLTERGINKNDFHIGSDKIKALIREITEQAAITCGFKPNEQGATPIMIEAVPYESDGILIIVSRVSNDFNLSEKFSGIPGTIGERHFIESDIKESSFTPDINTNNISIYSFNSLDDVERACHCIKNYYCGISSLYKYNNRYYLIIAVENITISNAEDFDTIISEFGQKHISNLISKGFLNEHGEILIYDNALNIMAAL